MFTKKEIEVLKLRKEGLLQVEIAKKLKISQAAVSKFEKNAISKIRDAKKLLGITKKLKVEVEDEIF